MTSIETYLPDSQQKHIQAQEIIYWLNESSTLAYTSSEFMIESSELRKKSFSMSKDYFFRKDILINTYKTVCDKLKEHVIEQYPELYYQRGRDNYRVSFNLTKEAAALLGIPFILTCSPANLILIKKAELQIKGFESQISLKGLLENHLKWLMENPEYYEWFSEKQTDVLNTVEIDSEDAAFCVLNDEFYHDPDSTIIFSKAREHTDVSLKYIDRWVKLYTPEEIRYSSLSHEMPIIDRKIIGIRILDPFGEMTGF